MEYEPVAAGPFIGHDVKVDGRRCLVVEGPGGSAFGMLTSKPNEQRSSRSDPKTLGTVLVAAGGSWFVPNPVGFNDKHRPVLDAAGVEVAGVDHTSSSVRALSLPGGALTWERHVTRPQYRVDGLFGASRSALHSFAAGVSRRPFKGEVTAALVDRPDASLVLLLACWLTNGSISAKVAAQSTG
jgi:hypothetical protein